MGDLTAFLMLVAGFSAVLAVALALPGRLLDWVDLHLLSPDEDSPAMPGRAVQTSHDD